MNIFEDYWNQHVFLIKNSDIDLPITKVIRDLVSTINGDARVYTAGNGGSAATAEHFAADLNLTLLRRAKRISAFCLSTQISTTTALANDISYDDVFGIQARNYLRPDDVIILFTASGNSNNILQVIREAKKLGARIHVFVGFDGGQISKLEGINMIHVNSGIGEYGKIENIHASICHFIIDQINSY